MEKTNLDAAFDSFGEQWSPRLADAVNDHGLKLATVEGEFDRHHHSVDELFMVRSGTVRLELDADEDVVLEAGEFVTIPAGVAHRPVAEREAEILLFEPVETKNTGNRETERTVEVEELE
ncbi:cupin domain-containing protein [Halococcus hamelinensis]|uniref:Cupin type-2 domain-containing protein n=1 Tax=Halococcus hamelinensis 100A6 TaxID=1132509 RepID=M0M2I5_9EURY|nr:cupin domain-containing protein [Halococcus hamelinensis]EMA39916.1 hypothetical protein C447_05173 [Halococcus hamelinensis 100A6]